MESNLFHKSEFIWLFTLFGQWLSFRKPVITGTPGDRLNVIFKLACFVNIQVDFDNFTAAKPLHRSRVSSKDLLSLVGIKSIMK